MHDEGHEWTTQQIIRLEAKVRRVYEDALSSANDKYAEFTAKFLIKDEIHRAELKAGKITKVDYRDWLKGQVFQRERLEAQIDDLARTMTNANKLAAQIINDATPEAFAYNANWAAFKIEQAGNANMGFGLYDAATVKRLIRDEPSLLPPSRVDIPRDLQWNTKKIIAQINQGIILGEDLKTIAKRLRTVTTANANMSLTHARTAMTGAQNAGRIETYHRAEKMGIRLEKEWLATLDSRTRDTHGRLDGQHIPVDDVFKVENYEIRYPGDPTAHPAMVYNCRCTLISRLLDYPAQNAKRRDESPDRKPIKDMTFKEWQGMKTTEMTRRKVGVRGQQIIDKPTYNKLTREFLRRGGQIIRGEEADRILGDHAYASYITGAYTAFIKDEATISEVMEEMFHAEQDRTNRFGLMSNPEVPILREIEAQEYLINSAERYKIPLEETEVTKDNLKYYQELLRKLREEESD